ncbi:hypothetical protein [Vibrio mexicanus]|uniref:hypothetical protein n=1 Tax=Vibrio mexicanus TaxID=1004326 RepID=UPI00063C2A9F|nr:hypothetical protein [Vibrio mexicanus]
MKTLVKKLLPLFVIGMITGCAVNASKETGTSFSGKVDSIKSQVNATLLLWRNARFTNGGVYSAFFVNDQRIVELRSGLVEIELEPGRHDITFVIPSNYLEAHLLPSKADNSPFVCNLTSEFERGKIYSLYFDQSMNNTDAKPGCRRLSNITEGILPNAYGQTEYLPDVALVLKRDDAPQLTTNNQPQAAESKTVESPESDASSDNNLAEVATQTAATASTAASATSSTKTPIVTTDNNSQAVADSSSASVATKDPQSSNKEFKQISESNVMASANESVTNDTQAKESRSSQTHSSTAITDGGYQWKQSKAELAQLPEMLRGGYPLYNEYYFYPEGYFLRLSWRLNSHSNQQENGSISNGAWKLIDNQLVTQEYLWSQGNRYAYREYIFDVKPDQLALSSHTIYHIRDSSMGRKGQSESYPNDKNIWIATKGDGPRLFHEYLNNEFSDFIGDYTKKQLNVELAKEKAQTPTKWKDNQAIQLGKLDRR